MQSAQKSTFTFREDGHFVANGSEQAVRVGSTGESEIFACSLLELGIKNMGISFENVDEMFFDFGEEVDPLVEYWLIMKGDCGRYITTYFNISTEK